MIELNKDQVTELAHEAVVRMGKDHVSPLYLIEGDSFESFTPGNDVDVEREKATSTCRYVTPQGGAGCIVGQVLHAAGVSLDALSNHEGDGANKLLRNLRDGTLRVDMDAEAMLVDLQSAQDAGVPWGWMMDNYGHLVDGDDLASVWEQERREKF